MYGIINFQTNLGSVLMIRRVDITPKKHAIIKCLFADRGGENEKHRILMEGDDYKLWGENDDYLGHYCIKMITSGTETIVGDDYVAPATTAPAINDDNRSVHNDADIARIQTLQEQLDSQALKLKTITDLLFKNGSI
jgi:hypothetical protein